MPAAIPTAANGLLRMLINERNVAVCLLPGTELAFDQELKCERSFGIGYKRLGHKVARFREIDKDRPNVHHGALELPDGHILRKHFPSRLVLS
jgi:hypothetical protein